MNGLQKVYFTPANPRERVVLRIYIYLHRCAIVIRVWRRRKNQHGRSPSGKGQLYIARPVGMGAVENKNMCVEAFVVLCWWFWDRFMHVCMAGFLTLSRCLYIKIRRNNKYDLKWTDLCSVLCNAVCVITVVFGELGSLFSCPAPGSCTSLPNHSKLQEYIIILSWAFQDTWTFIRQRYIVEGTKWKQTAFSPQSGEGHKSTAITHLGFKVWGSIYSWVPAFNKWWLSFQFNPQNLSG